MNFRYIFNLILFNRRAAAVHTGMSSTPSPSFRTHLPEIMQLCLSLPITALIYNDCITTLAFIYRTEQAQHGILRDLIFFCVFLVCSTTLAKTWLKTIVCVKEKFSETPTNKTIIIVTSDMKNAAKEDTSATSTHAAKTEVKSKENKENDEATMPCKPSTPPPVQESDGPGEE